MNVGTATALRLRRHRRVQRMMIAVMVTFVPAPLLAAAATRSETAFAGLAVIWFATIGVLGLWVGRFRCPACGKRFAAVPGRRGTVFRTTCANCGVSNRSV